MEALELLDLISGGETTTFQLKENITNAISAAQEIVAFANSRGGKIVIGVNDKSGSVSGLSFEDLQRIQNLLSTAANDHVKSPMVIMTEVVDIGGKKVIVATVPEGTDKPYTDKDGLIFLKNGADKRKVTSKAELSRLLQSSGNMYAEEHIIQKSTLDDLDWEKFRDFFEEKYKEECRKEDLEKHLQNLDLGKGGKLNIAGALLFGKKTQRLTPAFFIAAAWFWGNDITEQEYRSSENIIGPLDAQYRRGYDFILSKLDKVQGDQPFNSLGKSEIPEIVITELLVNALVHRDYYINDSIKIFVFQNRIEIVSPGKLPNSLTADMIRKGVRKSRNNILVSFAPDLLEYRGFGSGIVRALRAYPNIDFLNDTEGEQLKVTIHRKPR
ncbi:MAG: RNA-binding domain-containing protein [Saprospiraceae bacterium]